VLVMTMSGMADASVRRDRVQRLLLAPLLVLWLWATATVSGLWSMPWWGWVVVLAVLAGGLFLVYAVQRRRRAGGHVGPATALAAQHALRDHVDPGEPARSLADRTAGQTAPLRWMAPVYACLALSQLTNLGDEVPLTAATAAAGVVSVVGWSCLGVGTWRMGTRARRWLADPPGPLDAERPQLQPAPRRDAAMRVLAGTALVCFLLAAIIELVAGLR